ncbi:MAG TPA: hypothetical protein VKO20_07780 [Desulfosalsimonadaceae bacterium]|nr:hypothetical protein [Desulfosalsimonadaceae bacterium]
MKFRRNLRTRKARGFRRSAQEGTRRVEKWPDWKKNADLVKHITLLK